MQLGRWLALGAASSALVAAAIASAQPPTDVIGIWHACPDVGAGYCERWLFKPDGAYSVRPSEEGCSRQAGSEGRWERRGDTILLTERSRTELVGGRCERDPELGEAALVGASPRTIRERRPRTRRVALSACSAEERDQGAGECMRFGGAPRWLIATDPNGPL